LLGSVLAYLVFCGLGLISRYVPPVFALFLIYGIVFPIVWAKATHDWSSMGLMRRNLGEAIRWGIGLGVLWGIYTYLVFPPDVGFPPIWGIQVAIAVPVWFLLLSPFQEFFFRGWLQPRLQDAFGKWWGLLATAFVFTLWHFFPELEATKTATLPLGSVAGVLSTFLAGIVFGYAQDHTGNVVAPWIAHALGGIALVLIGRMTFLTYVP